MTVNARTIALIKEFEGFRAEAYRDIAGVWTIGYGTTAAAGVGIAPKAGMKITEADATMYLRRAIDAFATKISFGITAPINENEFGAFVSLAYNIGTTAFLKSSALKHFNAGNKAQAANAMLLWNKATVKGKLTPVAGLTRRRGAEKALFLSPVTEFAPPVRPDVEPVAPQPAAVWWWAAFWKIVDQFTKKWRT